MKEILCIKGGNILNGEVNIDGAKNSLVALIPASIITKSIVKLENVSPIEDTYTLIRILNKINVKTLYDGKSCLYIDARNVKNTKLDIKEMTDMRASYYFMGALLAMYNKVTIIGPGGCDFGGRPIDLHLQAFKCLGYDCEIEGKLYNFSKTTERKKIIDFEKKSVGATINAILASCRVKGEMIISNCSLEPEVDDLINFLNKCGCNIRRKEEKIIVVGVNKLRGCNYKVMFDRIEAGTFMMIGATASNSLKINNIDCYVMRSVIDTLKKIGVEINEYKNSVIVKKREHYRGIDVAVDTYPGFPTDLQQPLTVVLSTCRGNSSIRDTIYPSRFSHIKSLNDMNANISGDDGLISIEGNRKFVGCNVEGKDLRGGISLVLAALIAEGVSKVDGLKYIKRGYSNLVYKLKRIGADIRVEGVENEE